MNLEEEADMFLKLIHLENKIVLTFITPYRLSWNQRFILIFHHHTIFLYGDLFWNYFCLIIPPFCWLKKSESLLYIAATDLTPL